MCRSIDQPQTGRWRHRRGNRASCCGALAPHPGQRGRLQRGQTSKTRAHHSFSGNDAAAKATRRSNSSTQKSTQCASLMNPPLDGADSSPPPFHPAPPPGNRSRRGRGVGIGEIKRSPGPSQQRAPRGHSHTPCQNAPDKRAIRRNPRRAPVWFSPPTRPPQQHDRDPHELPETRVFEPSACDKSPQLDKSLQLFRSPQ